MTVVVFLSGVAVGVAGTLAALAAAQVATPAAVVAVTPPLLDREAP